MLKLLFFLLCGCCCATTPVKGQNRLVLLKSFDTLQASGRTMSEAQAAFHMIEQAPVCNDSRTEKANNCENRAELACHILEAAGFKPINFWIFKEGLVEAQFRTKEAVKRSNGLAFNTGIGKQPYVFWRFHTAAGVIMGRDTLIFDPWTQHKLVLLREWSTSFFIEKSGRTAYVLPVTGQYSYFGTTKTGQLSLDKNIWLRKLDKDFNQMYCGLCGFISNKACNKRRNKKRSQSKNRL